MAQFVRSFQVSQGVIAGESTPESPEELYSSPEEMGQLYGCTPTEQDIRAAMTIIHAYTNRPSLWPCEYNSGPLEIPTGRMETRLPITPVLRIVSIVGRYGQTRRDNIGWNSYQSGIAAYLLLTGAVPQWVRIDPAQVALDPPTGIITVPYAFLIAPFAFVEAVFISGYLTIPDRIKLAMAEIINNMKSRGVSDRIQYNSGRISRRYAGTTFVSDQAKMFLQPYVITALY